MLRAAPFTPGDIVIERVGDGSAALSSGGTPIFFDEYTPGGTLAQSIEIPTNTADAMVDSGTATSEGQVTLAATGTQLVFAGYNTNAGTAKVASGGATRVIGTVDYTGSYTLAAFCGTNYASNNIRSATSDGAGNFWAAGANSGTLFVNASNSATVQFNPSNTRLVEIFGGNLYLSTSTSKSSGIFQLSGLPRGAATPVQVITEPNSPYDFAVSPDTNTVYIADDNSFGSGGIYKYTNSVGGYQLAYVMTNGVNAPSGARSLAVRFGGVPLIYAVTTNNTVVAGYDTGTNANFSVVASAPTNTAFRGVKFAPQPAAGSGAPFTLGNLAVLRVGGANENVNTNGSSVHIDEFRVAGALVNTVSVPDSGANSIVLDSSTSEGFLTKSPDNLELTFGGYNAPPGTGYPTKFGLNGTASAAVPRSIVTVDGLGRAVVQIKDTHAYDTYAITSAVYDGESNFWMTGTGGTFPFNGLLYAGTAANPTDVIISSTGSTPKVLNIFDGSLFVDSSFAPNGIYQVLNTNTPVTTYPISSNYAQPVISLPGTTRNNDYVFDPGFTTCYYADSTIGIVKYTNNGGSWVSNYTIPATNAGGFTTPGALGITADWTKSPVVVYATTSESTGNRLIQLVDAGPSSVATLLAQAFTNHVDTTNAFRGLRFTPAAAPGVAAEPVDQFTSPGSDATFSVIGLGTPPLSYQWYSNGVALAFGLGESITITNPALSDNGTPFFVVITNVYGAFTSTPAILHVTPQSPTILSVTPSNSIVGASNSASFTVSAVHGANYFWFHGTTPLSDGGEFTNTATATLTINPAFALDDGDYSVIVSNQFGTATSSVVTLTVIDPDITLQPMGTTNLPGSTNTLSVTAVGSGTLTYQWLLDGTAISGAQSSSYTVPPGGPGSGAYSVIVSNALGQSVTSAVTVVEFSPYLIADSFTYPNGNITNTGVWFRHSGSGGDSDITNVVITNLNGTVGSNGVYEVSQNRADDVHRQFAAPVASGTVYASFTLIMNQLPTDAGGAYFAHFADTNELNNGVRGFWGRIFALTTNTVTPGTYRLGVANGLGDYSASSSLPSGPNAIYPLDLALGLPYQVVVQLDFAAGVSGNMATHLWVNPETDADFSVQSSDAPSLSGTNLVSPLMYYDFRQNGGEGVMYVDDLLVATNFGDVTTNAAALPIIGLQPAGVTNYANNDVTLEVAATGKGITYQWYDDGVSVGDSGTNAVLTLPNVNGGNSGDYTVVVTTDAGSVTSAVATVSISDAPTAPIITQQPTNATNFAGGSVVFTAAAIGTGPLTYQWYFDNGTNVTAIGDNGITVIGAATPRLVLLHLNVEGPEAGNYYVVVTGPAGSTQSSNALLVVQTPPITPIGTLRTYLNPATFTLSGAPPLVAISGTITTYTNLTSGNTASYYIQDSTGGMNLFITGDSTFRPLIGSKVTATGVLDVFDDLELEVNAALANNVYFVNLYTNGSNVVNLLPPPQVLPLDYLANSANLAYIVSNVDGSLVTLTNVYFKDFGTNFESGKSYVVSNAQGSISLYVAAQVTNLTGIAVPPFASSVTGPLTSDNGANWEIELTSPAQIVTNPPAPFSASATISGGVTTLTWPVVPYNYAYTVLGAPTVTGPYTPILSPPVSSAIVYTNGVGAITITNAGPAGFYQVVSP